MDSGWLDWVAVALLGSVVGASELISRYKDKPGAAITSWPAAFYIVINGAASVGALGLIRANGWFTTGRWTQILMAGVSAMAFFRTVLNATSTCEPVWVILWGAHLGQTTRGRSPAAAQKHCPTTPQGWQ